MKLLSRKSLVTAATVVAVSVSGLAAPAMAETTTPAATSTQSAPSENEGKKTGDENKTENDKKKAVSSSDSAKEIKGWVQILTAVASFFGAIITVGNAIKKLLGL
ncbi:hypothetical protein [Corynebacterium sp. TAE3-ERU16]|uniref:hypothetical protein n=1 Tax=Corynebacterium sp. TAE3-ERU16 TaxID=2849493 RepID=UPI001C449A1C|nr:hypothetical protein [Corynebacterium sp. TAE3-ERU16]MBV7293350.1 hypothetical protein [Corynebacterium sp. TAE3-ERU16]